LTRLWNISALMIDELNLTKAFFIHAPAVHVVRTV
jgi:hypothetical protein